MRYDGRSAVESLDRTSVVEFEQAQVVAVEWGLHRIQNREFRVKC